MSLRIDNLTLRKDFTWNETVWNPRMASRLRAWYDASDRTLVSATGGLIDSVTDKSGNGLTLASSSTARPTYTQNGLNSRYVFTYDGNDALTAASVAPWKFLHDSTGSSIFAVWQPGISSDPNAIYGLLGTNAGTAANIGMYVGFDDRASVSRNNKLNTFVTDNTTNWVINTSTADNFATPNASQICGWVINPSASPPSSRSSVRVNGGVASQTNTDNFSPTTGNPSFPLQLGASGNNSAQLVGTIAEVILFAGNIDDTTRQKLEGYLAHKWGLTSNLPSDHPYKTVGPTP